MQNNSTILHNSTPQELVNQFKEELKTQLENFKKELSNQTANDELLSREQLLELLQINASTLHRWTLSGKITVYKFVNKNYYKRSEIMESLTPLKK